MKSKRYLILMMIVAAVCLAGGQMFVKAENRAGTSNVTGLGEGLLYGRDSVIIQPAARVQFPGIVHGTTDPKAAGDVDCSSPAHWDGDTMYMLYSTGHPFRSSGSDLFHLSRPSKRVNFDNEAGWKMDGRWIESTFKAEDGELYMWYHNEPPLSPNRTAPRIGTMVSKDNGLTWRDLGIVLEAPRGSNNTDSANKYFVGGNGDFAVIADREKKYMYFFISTYNKDMAEQGVSVARMAVKDLDQPKGKVFKWHKGQWSEPGIGGHVTTIFSAFIDWHRPDADAFWGPSIHWNTYLKRWVMLLNRAKDKNWAQEGIYISFNPELSNPGGWTKPFKILDAAELEKSKWYPQVVGKDTAKRETDKLAGRTARLFVAGVSKWEIEFKKTGAVSTDLEPQQTDLFISGQEGYKAYRIPALVVSNKGTILAICEARKKSFSDKGDIDLAIKRSFDNGRTWTGMKIIQDDDDNTVGNPCPVVDRETGTIWLPFCRNNKRIFITKSTDDGATWSAPVEITGTVSKPEWTWYATGPGHGIQLSSGRLLIPCDHKIKNATKVNPQWYFSHIIYSDDHGKSWKLGGTLDGKTNECQAIEVEDGSVYLNIRSYEGKNRRAFAWSTDKGLTWSEVKLEQSMIAPKCQASIARFTDRKHHGKNRVLFSSPAGTERENMTIRLSYDECRTWPVSRTLYPGKSAYSELAIAPDMTICCFYERGIKDKYEKITFARFSLEWLTQGKESFITLNRQKQLFLDDYLIKSRTNIKRLIHPAQKYDGNPVLWPSEYWEPKLGVLYGSVIQDDGKYKMWYKSGMGVGYAESSDGIKWVKPRLDLVKIDGQKTNLLFLKRGKFKGPVAFPTFWEPFGVHKDEKDPDPSGRYKMGFLSIIRPYKGPRRDPFHPTDRRGLGIAGSGDGIHWKLINAFATEAICDGDTHWMFDPARKKYVLYGRTKKTLPEVESVWSKYDWYEQYHSGRAVARLASADFLKWDFTEPATAPVVLTADIDDEPGTEIYSMKVFPYEGAYIGLVQVFHARPEACYLDVQLAVSHDSLNFVRVGDRSPFIPVGPICSWDRFNHSLANNSPILIGDELRFYYGGRTYRHTPYKGKDTGPKSGGIGFATIKRDRFVSLQASFDGGQILTKPVRLVGRNLHINAKSDFGEILVEVLDLAGNSIARSKTIRSDSLDILVDWKRSSIKGVNAPVLLRFTLKNACLFAVWCT